MLTRCHVAKRGGEAVSRPQKVHVPITSLGFETLNFPAKKVTFPVNTLNPKNSIFDFFFLPPKKIEKRIQLCFSLHISNR